MTPRPYCGRCHQFMRTAFGNVPVCNCVFSGQAADTTRDPNCHNPSHDHHDPESPIVLARQAEYAAEDEDTGMVLQLERVEEPLGEILPLEELAEDVEIVSEQFRVADELLSGEDGLENNEFSFDTINELDEILEDTNEQVEAHTHEGDFSPRHHGPPHHSHDEVEQTELGEILLSRECDVHGHIWVKYGKVGFNDHGLSVVDWGPETCLRCQEPAPNGGLT